METTRQKKVGRMVQRELSRVLQKKVEPELGCMITLRTVRVSPDLRQVKAYISALPDDSIGKVLQYLEDEEKKIRYLLSSQIGKQVRNVPFLSFFEDDTAKYAVHMDSIFEEIAKERASREHADQEFIEKESSTDK